jgi:hypothetical protein
LDLSVRLIFKEATYAIPIKRVIELLVSQRAVYVLRSYTVQSVVSLAAFEAFWTWLFVGRVRDVPKVHAAECLLLAREFRILDLEPEYAGLLDPCVEECLLDEIFRRWERWCGALEARMTKLEVFRPAGTGIGV